MIEGKVLVTGATGDTGRATVDELLARGHQIRAVAHGQDERSKKLEERGVEVVYGDLLDFGQVRTRSRACSGPISCTPSAPVSCKRQRISPRLRRRPVLMASLTCHRSPRGRH